MGPGVQMMRGLTRAWSGQPRPVTSGDGSHIVSADCRSSANRYTATTDMLRVILSALVCISSTALPSWGQCPHAVPDSAWSEHTLRAVGIRVWFPSPYREHIYEVRIGNTPDYTYESGVFRRIHISLEKGPASIEAAKPRRWDRVTDFLECSDSIGGRPMVLQRMTGGGTIFRDGKQFPSFDVVAVIQLAPGRYIWIRGNAENQEGRDQIAGAIGTIQFLRQ
jgi:hypothetical protein